VARTTASTESGEKRRGTETKNGGRKSTTVGETAAVTGRGVIVGTIETRIRRRNGGDKVTSVTMDLCTVTLYGGRVMTKKMEGL
jgi:hypothetical protein